MSRISLAVNDAMLTLFRFPKSCKTHEYHISVEYALTYGKNQFLHSDLDLDPLLVRQRRPDEVRLSDCVLIRVKDDLGLLIVDVQTTQEEDKT
jgi:hypothetical protein